MPTFKIVDSLRIGETFHLDTIDVNVTDNE